MKTSIICCYYNEINIVKNKLLPFIKFIKKKNLEAEIIIVDNNSTDGTADYLKKLSLKKSDVDIKFIFNEKNLGKGGSIKKACLIATGKLACIFDIDEYFFNDLILGIKYLNNKKIDLLIGSRILKKNHFLYSTNLYGVIFLTKLINKLFALNLTDSAGAIKIFRLDLFYVTKIYTSGFDFEFELICKFAKKNFKISEYPCNYEPRTYEQGKKINPVRDGIKILLTIIRSYFV